MGYDAPVYHRRLRRATPQAGPAVSGMANRPAATELIPSAYLPRNEVVFIPAKSALVASVAARVGDLVRNSVVLTLATGNPYDSGVLSQNQSAKARRRLSVHHVSACHRLA